MRWQDVTFAPDGQLFAALASSPLCAAASYLLALSAAMAAIWTAREIVRTLAGTLLPSNQSGANQTGSTITIAAIVLALAALFLTTTPAPSATLLAWSASLAAAALAPVLFAAFVPRPSAPAALIAIPLGAATVLILILTARYNPFDAFAMSSALSGAPPAVIRKMASLLHTLDAVSVETARQTVQAQIETLARDGITWFGLKPLSCGAIGLALSSAVMAAGTALNAMKLQPD